MTHPQNRRPSMISHAPEERLPPREIGADKLKVARTGEAFSLATGRPVPWQRAEKSMSWYEFACAYADMKWKNASAKYRQDIARALTTATPALLISGRGASSEASIRRALHRWAFNTKQRATAPDDVADVLALVARSTMPVSALAEPAAVRRMLDVATTRLDGK